ncbi:MAG: TIR domain-containing protein [Leptolyngbyaceae cyanobacterium HOT.MB2.61]|nr:TIR domain-containing protein [Leptolyngbyaceae cyanobacterium HOT.MB2.61]
MYDYQDVFISYGRVDSRAFVLELHRRLSEKKLNIWCDFEDIPLGVNFQHQIDDAIEKTDNFLYVISPHAVNSPYCRKELEMAVQCNKRIIPLMHVEQIDREAWQQRFLDRSLEEWEDFKAKGLHSSFPNMHPVISQINWVFFREGIDDFEASFAGLEKVLERHADYVRQHTQWFVRALEWERHQKSSRYLLVGEEREAAEAWLKTRFEDEQPPCEPTDLHCEFICESIKNANNLMTQVFLCYADSDRAIAEKIAKTLMRHGLTVWRNQADIGTGSEQQEAIQKGIEGADNIVYMLSPNSLTSKFCQQALDHAFSYNKRIIPVRLQLTEPAAQFSCQPQRGLDQIYDRVLEEAPNSSTIPSKLQGVQFIDLVEHGDEAQYRDAMDRLLREIQRDAVYYEQHKVLLVKALKWQEQKCNPSILLQGYNLRHAEAWLKAAQGHGQHPPTAIQEEFIAESLKRPAEVSLDVFIAYSRVDSDFVRRLNDALQIQGKTTWFDQESIASGTDFQREIYLGIERCNNFLFVISPNSIHSPYCADEVEYAAKLNKRIVTVLHREVSPSELPPALAAVQWIDFRKHGGDFLANYGELLRTLDTDLEHVRAHTRLLMRAMEWEQQGQDDSFLLRGKDLTTSDQWLQQAASKQPAPTTLQIKYLTASRELPKRKVKPRTVLLTSLAASVLVAVARFLGLTQAMELGMYDVLLRSRPSDPQDNRFLIISVDEDSIRFLDQRYEQSGGKLPDRALVDLLNRLQPQQPRLIGLDFYRPFPAKPELAILLKQMQNLIVLCKSSYEGEGTERPPEVESPERLGFSDFVDDGGRTLRRHYLMQKADSKFCNTPEAFNLVLARRYLATEGKPFTSPLDEQGFYGRDMQFGKTPVPQLLGNGSGYQDINNQLQGYQTLLNYRAHEGDPNKLAPMISLKEMLTSPTKAEEAKDRIVLIGYTAKSTGAEDSWNTPYGKEIPGVVAQTQMTSQLLSAALNGRRLIWWWPLWGETLWIAGWALVGGVACWQLRRSPWQFTGVIVSLIALSGTCYLVMVSQSGWVPLVPPAIALIVTAGGIAYLSNRLRHQH